MPLVIYSRSPEVDYKWLQSSLDTSFDLVFTLSFAFATWLALCATGKLAATANDFILLGIHVIAVGLISYLRQLEINGWMTLLIHAVVSCILYGISKSVYRGKLESKRD